MEHLIHLLEDYLNEQVTLEDFREEFMSYYFEQGIYNHLSKNQEPAMEGILLAIGLTNDEPEAHDTFPSYITSKKLRYTIEENLPLLKE